MIFVKDLDRMVAFYRDTLGLTLIESTRLPDWAEFDTGAATFSLHAIPAEIARDIHIPNPPEPRETDPVKLSFEVDDPASERRRLESLAVPLLHRPWGAYDLVDPEGNVIGIYSKKE